MKSHLQLWLVALFIGVAGSGCTTPNMLDPEYRSNQLRTVFPAETSRTDIQLKLKSKKPTLSVERPASGWIEHSTPYLSKKIPAVEARTGKEIKLVERYLMADSRHSMDFLSLCNVWFYYDDASRLADVEWAWHTD